MSNTPLKVDLCANTFRLSFNYVVFDIAKLNKFIKLQNLKTIIFMNNSTKHKILKELAKTYTERTYDGMNYTESGKSLSLEELNIKTSVKLDNLNTILTSLKYNDYIKPVCLHNKTYTYYVITDKGFDALSDKRFVWYSLSTDKISIIISILALLVSIFDG